MKANEYLEDSFENSFEDDYELEYRPWDMDLNSFTVLMHLSVFAGMIVPMGGVVLPLVMWLTNKEKSSLVDEHGKNIMNWMISSIIYLIGSIILMVIGIGFLMLFTLIICSLVFTIMGAIKASKNEVFKYPLAIEFIK